MHSRRRTDGEPSVRSRAASWWPCLAVPEQVALRIGEQPEWEEEMPPHLPWVHLWEQCFPVSSGGFRERAGSRQFPVSPTRTAAPTRHSPTKYWWGQSMSAILVALAEEEVRLCRGVYHDLEPRHNRAAGGSFLQTGTRLFRPLAKFWAVPAWSWREAVMDAKEEILVVSRRVAGLGCEPLHSRGTRPFG